jgi:hypothetical protein
MGKTIAQGLKETLPADIYELAMKYQDPSHEAHKEDWEVDESDAPVDDGLIWVRTDEGSDFWRLVNNGKYQEARELLSPQKEADAAPDLFQTVKAAVTEALAEREHEQEQRMKEVWKEVMANPVIRHSEPSAPRLLTEDELERVGVTHIYHHIQGWIEDKKFVASAKIYYLGKCSADGDMFMERTPMHIRIYKGNLNPQSN